MLTIIIITLIFLISFFIALRSMHELSINYTSIKSLKKKLVRGAIVFFEDKIIHYSNHHTHNSSSSSSEAADELSK